jgi:hypothetical protein
MATKTEGAASPQLIVDLSSSTGPLKYGASGFLYGLGNAGIPSVNMLAPLKPQVAAQKPEGGLQHPNGDALNVADTFKAAGGREIEIYIQDIYPHWPYDKLGLDDYLAKVDGVVRQVMASPNRGLFSYVPFNEPDQIWYNKSDKKRAFFDDWETVCRKIRALDPGARIVGPNFARYDSAVYREFLTFARDNACLPDVVSWHELNGDFFANWASHYDDCRGIESSLGLPAREMCINEYGRNAGDLGVPGKLVQWIARFEASKVDACLAYWTTAGCLDDLVARDECNQATGGWWLYRWYGGLTGHTVKVVPPDAQAEGLHGLAALDGEKKQARILFGGCGGSADVVVKGFDAAAYFAGKVHVSVWATAFTGLAPSSGPVMTMEDDYVMSDGQLSVTVDGMAESSAYQMILSPAKDVPVVDSVHRQRAEYADLLGSARLIYGGNAGGSGTCLLEGIGAGVSFVLTAGENGLHVVRLSYLAGAIGGELSGRTIRLALDGSPLRDVPVPATADWNTPAEVNLDVFLAGGINRIAFFASTGGALCIDSIKVTPSGRTLDAYEAEAPANTLSGTAKVMSDPAASGGGYVGDIGNGAANSLQFNAVRAPSDGIYRMVVHFANAEHKGSHDYNIQVVDRYADIQVNGGAAKRVYFRNTFAWNVYRTMIVDVELKAGNNTIKFSNYAAYAPNIDKIEIASRF